MLMKLAMWGSVALSERWNAVAAPELAKSLETAIRLPNALAGVATTLLLFAVVERLFGAQGSARPDLRVGLLSAGGIPSREPEVWVIVQDEHLTFENQLLVEQLRRTAPWREIVAGHARAAQVFRIERRLPCCAAS